MNNYKNQIASVLENIPPNEIIDLQVLYTSQFRFIPQKTYNEIILGLCKRGVLVRLADGLYYKPSASRFGMIPFGENEIVSYYTRDKQGMVVGYKMYNKLRLTTQISKNVEVLSNFVTKSKTVSNVSIRKCVIEFNTATVHAIETLEILQNRNDIEDLNKTMLAEYMSMVALNYSDAVTVYVLQARKYKRNTILTLESYLNQLGVTNSLNLFL